MEKQLGEKYVHLHPTCDYKSVTSSDMSRLCEATFCYENMSKSGER